MTICGCLFCDTLDDNSCFTRHLEANKITVGADGSEHAFIFAPMLKNWMADMLENEPAFD